MAFVGLVLSERSSGEQRRQGSITKVGNSHVRRLLVESAWYARRHPKVGYELARRQRGQDAVVIERAWRCQQRLFQRWQRMTGRSKPHQKIVVACARELAGFVWAIATDQPLRSTSQTDVLERRAAGAPSHTENPRFTYAAPAVARDRRPATLDRGSSRRTPVMR